jgi:cellulose synthase/poly-beta-1,6-N-acetylglucosamine synthase-like glycosyltransferase
MYFNGTCGLWRRQAIEDAGNWHHDILTEDIDLSYRAQLAGYHCTYRTDLAVPGELPETIEAWRNQQFRWAKGSIQVARKLLPAIWRAPWTLWKKLAATLHLTHFAANPLVML